MAWEGSDRRQELPPDWDKRRAFVFARDGHRCTWRNVYGDRCDGPAEECDHIRPGNDHSYANLRSLCSYHHGKKSGAEGRQATARRRKEFDRRYRRVETHPGLL